MASSSVLTSLSLLFVLINQVGAQAPSLDEALTSASNLSSFHDLLRNRFENLLDTLADHDTSSDPITIIAPSNDAFERVTNADIIGPAFVDEDDDAILDVLIYHVLPGAHPSESFESSFQFLPSMLELEDSPRIAGGQPVGAVLQSGEPPEVVFLSGLSTRSVVQEADIEFDGGIIHIVDNFLLPPAPLVDTAVRYNMADPANSLTSIIGALYSLPSNATLPSTLNTTSNLTLFLPVNAALTRTATSLHLLSGISPPDFLAHLTYHAAVTDTPIYSANFNTTPSLPSLLGADAPPLSLRVEANSYFVNSARVLVANLLFQGGIVHVIDNVLSPQRADAVPNPTSATQAAVLPTGGGSAGESESESGKMPEAPFTTFLPGIPEEVISSAGGVGGVGSATSSTSSETPSSTGGSGGDDTSGAAGAKGELGRERCGLVVAFGAVAGVMLFVG